MRRSSFAKRQVLNIDRAGYDSTYTTTRDDTSLTKPGRFASCKLDNQTMVYDILCLEESVTNDSEGEKSQVGNDGDL